MSFSLDFTNDTEESLEQGGRVTQPGWYKVTLDDTYEDDGSGDQVLEFKIAGGAFDGSKLFDRIQNPDMAANDDTRKTVEKRAKLIIKRLGIAPLGQAAEIDWTQAIGREYVLETKLDTNTPKSGKNAGIQQSKVKVTFDGVFPVTHERVPAAVRAALGLPPAIGKDGKAIPVAPVAPTTPGPVSRKEGKDGSAAATATAGRPAVDVSNL